MSLESGTGKGSVLDVRTHSKGPRFHREEVTPVVGDYSVASSDVRGRKSKDVQLHFQVWWYGVLSFWTEHTSTSITIESGAGRASMKVEGETAKYVPVCKIVSCTFLESRRVVSLSSSRKVHEESHERIGNCTPR